MRVTNRINISAAALSLAMLAACGPQNPNAPQNTNPNTAATTVAPVPPSNATMLSGSDGRPMNATTALPVPNDGVPPSAAAPRPAGTPVPPAGKTTAAVAPAPAARPAPVALLGEVRSVEPIHERPPGTGKGAVIGGLLGGVVGNQFGHGNGRAAMTVLGAAGGAVAGNNVERNINKRIVGWRVSVRLDNGTIRTFEEKSTDGLRAGDRVRIEGKHVRRA